MKTIKIPTKEAKKITKTVQLDPTSLANTKIAVDNTLAGLENHLRDKGFRYVTKIPKFPNLPKKEPEVPNDKRFRNKLWKDKAIHRWLNENYYQVFVTTNTDPFYDFLRRYYSMIQVDQDIINDHGKLSTKLKLLIFNASHPYVQLFAYGRSINISRSTKLIFPKVKKK